MPIRDLKAQIARLPEQPGVYLFSNGRGEALYVGKARTLRDRVRSYLGAYGTSPRIDALLDEASRLEVIVTDSVVEALALENNLIKQRAPRFNILLRDDKTYPYLQLTTGEAYPRVLVARRVDPRDGHAYAGPFMPAALARKTMSLTHTLFGIRSCNEVMTGDRARPCLEFDIKRCVAPCVHSLCSEDEYAVAVEHTKLFLEGRNDELLLTLRARMADAASHERFEQAAQLRDAVKTIETLRTRQQKMAGPEQGDRDAFGLNVGPAGAVVQVFQMRRGRVVERVELVTDAGPQVTRATARVAPTVGSQHHVAPTVGSQHHVAPTVGSQHHVAPTVGSQHHVAPTVGSQHDVAPTVGSQHDVAPTVGSQHDVAPTVGSQHDVGAALAAAPGEGTPECTILQAAIQQFYADRVAPPEIHVPVEFPEADAQVLEGWLSAQAGRRVQLVVPKRGEKRGLLDLAARNATVAYQARFNENVAAHYDALETLRVVLALPSIPRRIECFDISTIQGSETVASMVVCEDGRMRRSEYRKFRIRGGAMTKDGRARPGGATPPPPVNNDFAAMHEVVFRRYRTLLDAGGPFPDFILIDGGKGQVSATYEALEQLGLSNLMVAGIAKKEELLYTRDRTEPIALGAGSPALLLIQRIRDEAHRFAVTFHRQSRTKRDLRSDLDVIPGIGPRRRKALLTTFGSLAGVRRATREELVRAVGRKTADAVLAHFTAAGRAL